MPRVPLSTGPQVERQTLQPVMQRTPDVSSGLQGLARGLDQAGETIDQIALRDDQAKAFAAEQKITSDWLQWDAQARQQYRGQNVGEYQPAAQDWWKKASETFGKELTPRAQALISRSLMAKQNQAMGSVLTFSNAEKERHADETAAADIQTTIQFGISNDQPASAAQQIREKVGVVGARKGWTTEQVQAEVQKNLSVLHIAQISKLADIDATKAQAYYDANKGEVAGPQQARIEQILKDGGDNQFATKFAADHANEPLGDQIKAASEITDPARRAKAIQQVKLNYAAVKEAQNEREKGFADQAWQMVGAGKKVPEAVLAGMDGRERVQLQDFLRQRAEHAADRAERKAAGVKTDPNALARVYDLMRDDPEEFKKLRMVSLTNSIGASDMEQISRIQRDMLKPDSEKNIVTTTQAIDSYTAKMGKPQATEFKAAAFKALDDFQQEKKRQPTAEERRKILDGMVVEGVIERDYWFDTTKPRYQMTPEEQAKAKFPQKAPDNAGVPRVKSVAEARALPKGTRFIDPNGVERIR